jgi:hypothetical protein
MTSSVYVIVPTALGPEVYLASKRSEYEKQENEIDALVRGKAVLTDGSPLRLATHPGLRGCREVDSVPEDVYPNKLFRWFSSVT